MPRHVSMIAAISAETRALGMHGKLLWEIPDDKKRFRAITAGHPVIMGRKTWESLPSVVRPMPGRTNVVITRQDGYVAEGATVVSSIEDALAVAKDAAGSDEIFIIGGGDIYAAALPYATRLYLTLIDAEKEGDAFFPEYKDAFTRVVEDQVHEYDGLRYRDLTLERP